MRQLIQHLRSFRGNGFSSAPIPAVPPESQEVVPIPSKVAFEARPRGASSDSPLVQMVFPTRIRQHRIESEAIVYVNFFEDFGKAVRFIQLHGKMKAEFGDQIPMFTVDYAGKRFDDVLREASEEAVGFLHAVRNPVECPVIEEDSVTVAPAAAPSLPPHRVDHQPAAAFAHTDSSPLLVEEGEYQACGSIPWEGPKGQKGKASFCVVLRQQGARERKFWGSDLERAIRDAGVLQGDAVRLIKYPKTKVAVGNRIVQKNIWICERL